MARIEGIAEAIEETECEDDSGVTAHRDTGIALLDAVKGGAGNAGASGHGGGGDGRRRWASRKSLPSFSIAVLAAAYRGNLFLHAPILSHIR